MKKFIRSGWLWVVVSMFTLVACTKEKSLEMSDPAASQENTWRFTEGNTLYSGVIDTVIIEEINGLQIMGIEGMTLDGVGSLGLAIGGAVLQAGDYLAPFSAMIYLEEGLTVYESTPDPSAFKITISRLDAEKVIGTFSGKALDSTGAERTITSGSFSATR
ncbi:hypothetical protein ACFSQD_09770 [Flavihumibacter stibioxidans]|uniref:Uncharacterized protein n=1 Tax=Flavihumibacter stibioxidans TaxID=1834163 RepID=A0ABR7M784_9BACT|nr:hypothetical protein [Flavihumibacter stibioxidans]MBC6490600.1 hypothetical protein [Flavihumibacter stibioxidans]